MGDMFQTPPKKWHIAVLTAVLWLLVPVAEAAYYLIQEERGAYPANADTIAIPIYFFTIAWMVVSPIFALLAWLVVRTYRGGFSLWAFDTARLVRSLFGSLIWGGLVVWCVYNTSEAATIGRFTDSVLALLWAYLFLCFRSSVCASSETQAG